MCATSRQITPRHTGRLWRVTRQSAHATFFPNLVPKALRHNRGIFPRLRGPPRSTFEMIPTTRDGLGPSSSFSKVRRRRRLNKQQHAEPRASEDVGRPPNVYFSCLLPSCRWFECQRGHFATICCGNPVCRRGVPSFCSPGRPADTKCETVCFRNPSTSPSLSGCGTGLLRERSAD